MTLYEYMLLSQTDQWDDLWKNGEFIISINAIDSKYSLYALYGFFVEVELNSKSDKIIGKKHFKHGQLMDKYSGSIDINKI